jgi:mRNA interferase YafQ
MSMRVPEYSTRFQRDVKLARKRGKDVARLREVLAILIAGEPLPPRCKDHALKNDWSGYRDAHIEPDWLLIYRLEKNIVRFERTGTHSDLFE